MLEKDLELLGSYEPGFFHLFVNTTEDIFDLNKLYTNPESKRLFSSFFHEYIHFLQEITSTSTVWAAGRWIDYIKEVNGDIRARPENEFKVPYNYSNKFNVRATIQLLEIYRGDVKKEAYAKYDYYDSKPVALKDKDGTSIYPKKYWVYYHMSNQEQNRLHFGYLPLKEYVAHTLQNKYLPLVDHDIIPYLIVEQIVEKECPSFGGNSLHLVALCDACLMFTHPAHLFFRTLDRIKKIGFTPSDCPSVYNFVFADFKVFQKEENYSFEGLYAKACEYTLRQLEDALSGEHFAPTLAWISYVFREGRYLREAVPDFMTKIVEEEGKLSKPFLSFMRTIGTPFFTNAEGSGGFSPPEIFKERDDIEAYCLSVFREILSVFKGNRKCGLFHFCKSNPKKNITNSKCLTAPWERAAEEELCPFGRLWETWGLNGKIPTP